MAWVRLAGGHVRQVVTGEVQRPRRGGKEWGPLPALSIHDKNNKPYYSSVHSAPQHGVCRHEADRVQVWSPVCKLRPRELRSLAEFPWPGGSPRDLPPCHSVPIHIGSYSLRGGGWGRRPFPPSPHSRLLFTAWG